MDNAHKRSSGASNAIEETMAKLDQVFKLRSNRTSTVDDIVGQLRARNKQLQFDLNDVTEKYQVLSNTHEEIISQNEAEITLINNNHSVEVTELQEKINSLQAQVAEVSTMSVRLKAEEEFLSEENQKISKDYESIKLQRDELQVLLHNLEVSVEDKIAKTASEAERLIHQTKARHDVEKRRMTAQLREADSRAESVKAEAEKKVDEYKTKFEIERKRTVAMEREYEAMQQENNRLNTIVNSIQGTVDQLLTEEIQIAGKVNILQEDIMTKVDAIELNEASASISVAPIDLTAAIKRAAESDLV